MSYEITEYHGRYNRTVRTSNIKYIVVHYTGGTGSARNNCIYFSGGDRGASAHYFIDDTSIYEYLNPKSYASWHCGDGKGKYGITNQNSIGIEVVNAGGAFSEEEIKRLTWLVQHLMAKYGIPAENVVRHYDASRKKCPAGYIAAAKWKELHAQITGGKVDATTTTTTTKKESGTVTVSLNVLSKGSSGSQVKTLQRILISMGYNCGGYGVDGSFGAGTDSSVRAFQKAKGLVVDGYVGQNTWNALLK